MVRNNEETSLVKIDNSIFGKMKRFWNSLFLKRNKNYDSYEVDENNTYKENENTNSVQEVKKAKLFNFDAPENDINRVPNNDDCNEIANAENSKQYTDVFSSNNQSGVGKYFDEDEKHNYSEDESESNEDVSNEYEVKDEIQEKLMNYYASIKNSIKQ